MKDYSNLTPIIRTPEQIEKSLSDCATLPVHYDTKVCATKNGYKSAIKNAPIAMWIKCYYNLAISLPLSNLVCIDVDMHGDVDGLKAFKELVEQLGDIESYTELTATNGGLHIFISKEGIDETVKNCDLAPGVELKVNCYVVCASSVYKGNQYKIINGVNPDGSYKFSIANDKWRHFINEKGKKGVKSSPNTKTYEKRIFTPSETPLQYRQIIENCRLMKFMYENPDEIPEPVWFSAISMLTKNANTNDFIHWISEGHSNYTTKETDYKIERCRNTSIHRGCNYIATNHYEYCKGCPKAEQIKRRNNYGK